VVGGGCFVGGVWLREEMCPWGIALGPFFAQGESGGSNTSRESTGLDKQEKKAHTEKKKSVLGGGWWL